MTATSVRYGVPYFTAQQQERDAMTATSAPEPSKPSTASGPARMEALDGLRGYFLVFMLLNHLSLQYGYLLVKFNHNQLAFVEDAPGFVFLSGLLIGMVYTGKMLRKGLTGAGAMMWRRAGELFVYSSACILTVLLLAWLVPHASHAWDPWLGRLNDGGHAYILAALALLYQPTYMDILPQYIVYLLAAPPLLWLCVHRKWHWVAVASLVLWLSVQLGLAIPVKEGMNQALGTLHEGMALRGEFNMLAWQIVFMGGMVLGTLTAQGAIDWGRVFSPRRSWLLKLALGLLAFFTALKLSLTFGLLPQAVLDRVFPYIDRPEFSAIYLLNFVALACAVAWLMLAGPSSDNVVARRTGAVLNGLFRLRFLRLLGRHSLQVYAWHVIVVYLIAAYDRHAGPLPELTKNLIAVGAVASLALPALYREWRAAERPLAPKPVLSRASAEAAG